MADSAGEGAGSGLPVFSAAADARYDFTPDTGNMARVDFAPVQAAYVRLVFSANSSSRTNGAQAAEIMVFE